MREQGSPHRRRETLCARKQGFMFLPSKHHLDKASNSHSNAKCEPPSPNTMANLQRSPPRSPVTMGTARRSCAARIQTGPVDARKGHKGSKRREPIYARNDKASCDVYPPSTTCTEQAHCNLQSWPCKSPYRTTPTNTAITNITNKSSSPRSACSGGYFCAIRAQTER